MARPVLRSLERFPTKTKLLYDTRIKALRRSFRKDGHANDAYFVFDYIFREIFGNEGYYIRYTDDFVGDTADFCYVNESFVIDVIKKCVELDLFDKRQFEQNEILTSRAIQNKYQDIFEAMKRMAEMDSRFCVLDGGVYSEETPVFAEGTPVFLEGTPENREETPLKKEREEKKERGERKETPPPGDVQHHFSAFLAAWDTLANDENAPVKAAKRKWDAMNAPDIVVRNYLDRCQEYGEATVLAAIEQLRNAKFWHGKTIGLPTMLDEQKFQKLIDGEYDNLFAKESGKPDKSKNQIIQSGEQVGTWSWQNQGGSAT